jgi:peptidoglycan/xylan/chitin deacetylase (PgdA/CDA1 family)
MSLMPSGTAHAPGLPSSDRLPTDVCITIDTEFSIGGAFADPLRYRPLSDELVNCTVDDAEEGLGFLLRLFRQYDVTATFFIEVLQSYYFGDLPMGRIAERIAKEHHDIQMHLHPCWTHFLNHWRTLPAADDTCATRTVNELAAMMDFGVNVFSRWSLPPPVALRAGGFSSSRAVYQAMGQLGLRLASNIALGINLPLDPDIRFENGSRFIEGILEIPAFTYEAFLPLIGSHSRTLAITACSWAETESLLWQARAANLAPIVILTHPFEFVKKDGFRYERLRRNRVNQVRLEQLLRFIREHDREFTSATFGANGDAWLAAGGVPEKKLQTGWKLGVGRAAENIVNDLLWRY